MNGFPMWRADRISCCVKKGIRAAMPFIAPSRIFLGFAFGARVAMSESANPQRDNSRSRIFSIGSGRTEQHG
jgi:hypothetical protein